MGISIGIVGLPNVGKSSLFNALVAQNKAYVAEFPFSTIDPNIANVFISDRRLIQIAKTVQAAYHLNQPPKMVPASLKIVDIAGLVKGAHQGKGLGNQFLGHIREVDAIVHVLGFFKASNNAVLPEQSWDIVQTELLLADLATLQKQTEPKNRSDKEVLFRWQVVQKLKKAVMQAIPVRNICLSKEEEKAIKSLGLLTAKPVLVVLNLDEQKIEAGKRLEKEYAKKLRLSDRQVMSIAVKTEAELVQMPQSQQKEYRQMLGMEEAVLDRLFASLLNILNLSTFYTCNTKEAHAWLVRDDTTVKDAAGLVHSDFREKFIKAEAVGYKDFVKAGGWRKVRDLGLSRLEGKDCLVQDGDVLEFKIA